MNQIPANFEKLRYSYAEAVGLPRRCYAMSRVEEILIIVMKDKKTEEYPDYILVAIAGAIGVFATMAESIIELAPRSMSTKRVKKILLARKYKDIENAIRWASTGTNRSQYSLMSLWYYLRGKKNRIDFAEAEEILPNLFNRYESLTPLGENKFIFA